MWRTTKLVSTPYHWMGIHTNQWHYWLIRKGLVGAQLKWPKKSSQNELTLLFCFNIRLGLPHCRLGIIAGNEFGPKLWWSARIHCGWSWCLCAYVECEHNVRNTAYYVLVWIVRCRGVVNPLWAEFNSLFSILAPWRCKWNLVGKVWLRSTRCWMEERTENCWRNWKISFTMLRSKGVRKLFLWLWTKVHPLMSLFF